MNMLSYSYDIGGLGCWLSVDPMAGKYPHQSNYVYCSNNPIRLIDPDGRDEYEFDKQGNFLRRIESEKDNLVIVNGKKRTVSRDFDKGTFDNYFSNGNTDGEGRKNGKDANGNTVIEGLSGRDAAGAFSFMGEHTSVEWGLMEKKENGVSSYTLGTAHNLDGETFVSNLVANATPGSVVRYDHSHPNTGDNNLFGDRPSTSRTSINGKYSDVAAWKEMIKIHPNISCGISFKGRRSTYIEDGKPKSWFSNTFYNSK